MVKKRNRYMVKTTGRMILVFLFFGTVISTLCYTFFHNLYMVNDMKKELKKLENMKVSLLEEEDVLNSDINRLSDPAYVARFAREKYLYSKNGEIILRIVD